MRANPCQASISLENISNALLLSLRFSEKVKINGLICDFVKLKSPEYVIVSGQSGSGKSTLLASIFEAARSYRIDPTISMVDETAYLGQLASPPPLSLLDFVSLSTPPCALSKYDILSKAFASLKISPAPYLDKASILDKGCASLSGGEFMKLRIALAVSSAPSPRLLMFDESLGMLHESSRISMRDRLKEYAAKNDALILEISHAEIEHSGCSSLCLL